ncbi:halocyanin domain-containing protein [Halogranum gelatinilyticum]|uniref:Halocyanin domain-containing protein n=1 Tax=Halogranum gelatinilyticum TaxID=660521 RepID=A0A1G9X3M4_9EURY|nr:halocyanin domain-containing protein [Halogranum gelatinilyticum]SDM91292.1 halocyanin domain-containing protein [Halogranum gelatinilyticum]
MTWSPNRRRLLHSAALLSVTSVAGCLSSAVSDSDGDTPADAEQSTTADTTPAEECSPDEPGVEATELTPPEDLDGWLSDANHYPGEITRVGHGGRASISVGEPTDGGLAFYPPAVEVAPMTRVTWEWTGHGEHNVVALDGTFDSGRPNGSSGLAYSYIFDEPGVYPFVSEPHYGDGMKGAVVVAEPPSTGYEEVDEWVVDSGNFDGSVADETDSETATVRVGAEGNRGTFAFDPPVLKVSIDTTITWEWTGAGPHNVAFEDIDVTSGTPTAEEGATFEHTFEESGVYLYACEPHQSLGMKGAVIVE